ncbi:MAG: hypothetical protein H0V93_14680 [Euzebyales bacterium]|jgi:hypothetical protein|nr:hypothetical protein [Euzebyales bacterium]
MTTIAQAGTETFAASRDCFETVLGWLDGAEAAGLSHGELKTRLEVDARELFRQLLQDQRYQPWFDNARRLRELVAELEALSLRAAERAEGWPPKQ